MRKLNLTTRILVITFIILVATSCKDTKKEQHIDNELHNEASHDMRDGHHNEGMEMNDDKTMGASKDMMTKDSYETLKSTTLVNLYLQLKDALVSDDEDSAANVGEMMVPAFNDFKTGDYTSEQQTELTDIIEDAKEHAEHIAKSPIDHQREHFDVLSKDMIDLIAITGTDKKLYQDFCPMYNNKKGAQWLSQTEEIINPYYGSKMPTCGAVLKEIN